MTSERAEKWGIAPYFLVDDVVASANYYRDDLGFKYERFWGEPPEFCMVHRGGVVIMLKQTERGQNMNANGKDNWDAYLWIANADELYAEFKSKNVAIVRDICDQEYGCRDFEILDLNGYRLCFGQDLER